MNNLDTRYSACTITPHQRRCVDRNPNSQMVGNMESGLFRIARYPGIIPGLWPLIISRSRLTGFFRFGNYLLHDVIKSEYP